MSNQANKTQAISQVSVVRTYQDDPTMTPQKWVQWACDCAERVAHLVPPDGGLSEAAVAESKRWIANPTEENSTAAAQAADKAWRHHGDTSAGTSADDAAYAARSTARAINNAGYAVYVAEASANAVRLDPSRRAKGTNKVDYHNEVLWQTVRLMEIYGGEQTNATE